VGADQHPSRRMVRLELPVGQLHSYLAGVLGVSGVTVLVLEGRPDDLRGLFEVGLAAVARAEADAGVRR